MTTFDLVFTWAEKWAEFWRSFKHQSYRVRCQRCQKIQTYRKNVKENCNLLKVNSEIWWNYSRNKRNHIQEDTNLFAVTKFLLRWSGKWRKIWLSALMQSFELGASVILRETIWWYLLILQLSDSTHNSSLCLDGLSFVLTFHLQKYN